MVALTIVIPLYNEEQFLERCLKSIELQDNHDFEVLLINDASTDQTATIVQKFIKRNKNFKMITQPSNLGVSAARNRGLQLAQGQLITFIDGDDWLEPSYTDFFLKSFQANSIDMAICGYYKESPRGSIKVRGKHLSGMVKRNEVIRHITKISGQVMGYTWNKVYRLEFIRQHHLKFANDLSMMEDQVFNVQYAAIAHDFYVQPQPLYHYWQHENSATHSYGLENAKSIGLANYRVVKALLADRKSENLKWGKNDDD